MARQNGTTKCTCSFDSRNNVVRTTDELDNVTSYAYDGLSRRVSTTRELRADEVRDSVAGRRAEGEDDGQHRTREDRRCRSCPTES